MFLLDYVLPQVAKLSKILQTEKLDVTVISSLVEAALHSVDDALTLAANWVLALREMEKSLEETISVKITVDDISKTLKPMFANSHTLANVCMSLPVGIASVESSFSNIKTQLRNRLSEKKSFLLNENRHKN